MVYMQMCREELFDMPVFGTGEMLYFFTFAEGITSGVNHNRTAARFIGKEIAVGLIRVEYFCMYLHMLHKYVVLKNCLSTIPFICFLTNVFCFLGSRAKTSSGYLYLHIIYVFRPWNFL